MSDPEAVSEDYVDALIESSDIQATKMGRKTLILHAVLPNGFEVTTHAACVNPADFDYDVGKEIAMRRLKDKVWELEGYRAQCRACRRSAVGEVDNLADE